MLKFKHNKFLCCLASMSLLFATEAMAGTCSFKLDKKQSQSKLYINKNQAFYVYRVADNRYGDMEHVYDAISCNHITTGASDKSNFNKVLSSNNFESFDVNAISHKEFTNTPFSMFISVKPNGNNLNINIEKASTQQLQALADLQTYIKSTSTTLNSSSRQLLLNDKLLQKMLNQHNNSDATFRKLGLMIANNDYANAKTLYQQKGIAELAKAHPLNDKYRALTMQQGNFNDVLPLAKDGNNQALSVAFRKAVTHDKYRAAELLLINQIKDKLFTVNANIQKGRVSSSTWNENRIFGRTTDEGAVVVNSPVSYQISLNPGIYQPKSTLTIKAKLTASVSYTGTSTQRTFSTDLIGKISNDKTSDKGQANIEWTVARAGAGSWQQQNYTATNVSFYISNIVVE